MPTASSAQRDLIHVPWALASLRARQTAMTTPRLTSKPSNLPWFQSLNKRSKTNRSGYSACLLDVAFWCFTKFKISSDRESQAHQRKWWCEQRHATIIVALASSTLRTQLPCLQLCDTQKHSTVRLWSCSKSSTNLLAARICLSQTLSKVPAVRNRTWK